MAVGATGSVSEWPRDGLVDVRSCPACGSGRRELLYEGLTDRTYLSAPGAWRLIRCASCSCCYLDPRPSEGSLHLAYRNHYEGPVDASGPVEPSGGTTRRLRRAVRDGYLNARYGYALRPASRLGPLVVRLLPRQRERADELVRHLPAPAGEGRLLDVGCGEGDFLAQMRARGWDVEGIEPSSTGAAAARLRGARVAEGTLAEVDLEAGSLDAVTFRLAFEALPDPRAALEQVRDALRKGGRLWIATPNLGSAAHRRFGPAWVFLDVPRSAVLHTWSSLGRLLRESGFAIDSLRASRQARWSYRLSHAIAAGVPPFRRRPGLPARLALEARLVDLRAARRPERRIWWSPSRGGASAVRAALRQLLLRAVGRPLAVVLAWASRRSARRVGAALVYHRVGDPPGDLRRELLPALGASLFAVQLGHLTARYRIVPASELLEAARRRQRGERFPLAITFDDDLRSHVEVAAPLLSARGATATFFLCGASLEAPARFWWERLQDVHERDLDLAGVGLSGGDVHALGRAVEELSPEQREAVDAELRRLAGPDPPEAGLRAEGIARLVEQGFELGFHTLRHDPLPALDDQRLEGALREGRAALEQAAGVELRSIAYPHGRADARVAEAARAAGFELGFSGQHEPVTPESDPLLLGRLSPSYDSVGELAFRVAWALAFARPRGRN